MLSTLSHLECPRPACRMTLDPSRPQNLCPACRSPVLARYDLAKARTTFNAQSLKARTTSMWRYEEVLPSADPVTLGEGMTPLLHAARLGEPLGLASLYIKDEGQNPTASFKARGLSAAVTWRARSACGPSRCRPPGTPAGPLRHTRRRRACTASSRCPSDTPVAIVLECACLRRRRPSDRWPHFRLRRVHRRARRHGTAGSKSRR